MLNSYARRCFKNSSVFTPLVFQTSFDLLHYKYFCHHNPAEKVILAELLSWAWELSQLQNFSKWVMAHVDSQACVTALETEVLICTLRWTLVIITLQNLAFTYLLFCWGLANAYIHLQRAVPDILFWRFLWSRMNFVFLIIQTQMACFCIKTNMYFSLRIFGIGTRKKFKIGKS